MTKKSGSWLYRKMMKKTGLSHEMTKESRAKLYSKMKKTGLCP
jgi:hypothetical protein